MGLWGIDLIVGLWGIDLIVGLWVIDLIVGLWGIDLIGGLWGIDLMEDDDRSKLKGLSTNYKWLRHISGTLSNVYSPTVSV